MKRILTSLGAAALVVGLAAPANVAVAADESCCTVEHIVVLEHMIMDAKTAADHLAIASRYETSAKALEAQAETHDRLAKQYKTLHTKGANPADHCQRLAKNFRESAKLNRDLAETHRELSHSIK